jgi:hypothetical protein
MATNISFVQNTGRVITAEFVRLSLNRSNTAQTNPGGIDTYTFSTAYRTETIDGQVFLALGGLLGIAAQQRDIEATNYDTAITLTGIQQENIWAVLSSDHLIKGSLAEIWRGFYDDAGQLQGTSKRFTGVITNYVIEESLEEKTVSYNVTITCSSYKTALQNRVAGRFTAQESWQKLGVGTDTSMNRVASLGVSNWDFGKK